MSNSTTGENKDIDLVSEINLLRAENIELKAKVNELTVQFSVVELLADGAAFEVEFSDRNGRTYESIGLRVEKIMVLHFEPASPDIKPEMVTA